MNSQRRPSVLLVSIDALKPEFVLEQQRLGIQLPTITHYFVENGMVARNGMKSVFPTFTYPCHQSIITGTRPATHGIVNNGIFDPTGIHLGPGTGLPPVRSRPSGRRPKRGAIAPPAWRSPPR